MRFAFGTTGCIAGIIDIAEEVDAGEDVLADPATDQPATQLQLVGDHLEAGLALRASGRQGHDVSYRPVIAAPRRGPVGGTGPWQAGGGAVAGSSGPRPAADEAGPAVKTAPAAQVDPTGIDGADLVDLAL